MEEYAHPARMLELRILNISKYHIPGYFPKKQDFIGKKYIIQRSEMLPSGRVFLSSLSWRAHEENNKAGQLGSGYWLSIPILASCLLNYLILHYRAKGRERGG